MRGWILLRAAGFGAYAMLFASVAWGLLASASLTPKRISKASANLFHAAVASAGLALLGVHLGLLLVDEVVPFGVLDLLVPMRSSWRPTAVALGVIAMYALVAILVTSWLRRRLGTAWWRRVHLLAAPAFGLTLLHGLLAGTDARAPWALALYATTGGIVLFLVLVRGFASVAARTPSVASGKRREPASAA